MKDNKYGFKFHKHAHIKKNLTTKIFLFIFFISILTLIITFITNIILIKKNVIIPRIFFPSTLLFMLTILCAGGIVGSYGAVRNISELDLLFMRKCASIFMLLVCTIILPISLFQKIKLSSSFEEGKKFCKANNDKPKSFIYLQSKNLKDNLISTKNKLEELYQSGVTCLEKQKCLRAIEKSNIYICNYNYLNQCKEIFEAIETMRTYRQNKILHQFISACIENNEINKLNNPESVDKKLYTCTSEENLEVKIEQNDEKFVKEFYDKKMKEYQEKINDYDYAINLYKETEYIYDIKCFGDGQYKLIKAIIYIDIFTFFTTCSVWIVQGVLCLLKVCKIIEDNEMSFYKAKQEKLTESFNNFNKQKDANININEEMKPIID